MSVWWMKELHTASEVSVAATSADTAAAEADDELSSTDVDSKSLEKYAPIITQFKVCIIQHMHFCRNNNNNN